MKPNDRKSELLIGVELESFLDKDHSLYRLANSLNWDYLVRSFGPYYAENNGRPGVPIRVIAGFHYLKYLENESDESVVEKFCENPYWQYFCGFKTFQHELPCHPTTLVKWRHRVGEAGVEKLLSETINTAKREGLLPEKVCRRVNVDTTVQEKAVAFPTDGKLYHKMRQNLVKAANKRSILLRQSYSRVGKMALLNQNRYAHARQMKRAKKQLKKLKTYLGRVLRDIIRKAPTPDAELSKLLHLAKRLLQQKRDDKKKLYSLHAPEVECIAKGKSRVKYEFGCKVAVTTTSKDPWVISIFAAHGNPYDGHTLGRSLEQSERITQVKIENAFVDRGYRGKENHPIDTRVFISGTRRLPNTLKKLLRGRSGIEPIIGHLKEDHRLDRNYLLGKSGDKVNAILTGCAFNLKKVMRLLTPSSPVYV
ncbi:MAG TPA: IS5 family transposase [Gammaproteobacteria bacterium]|nr:IS5 family transposase [Gammaproteobacteria bacterium]